MSERKSRMREREKIQPASTITRPIVVSRPPLFASLPYHLHRRFFVASCDLSLHREGFVGGGGERSRAVRKGCYFLLPTLRHGHRCGKLSASLVPFMPSPTQQFNISTPSTLLSLLSRCFRTRQMRFSFLSHHFTYHTLIISRPRVSLLYRLFFVSYVYSFYCWSSFFAISVSYVHLLFEEYMRSSKIHVFDEAIRAWFLVLLRYFGVSFQNRVYPEKWLNWFQLIWEYWILIIKSVKYLFYFNNVLH